MRLLVAVTSILCLSFVSTDTPSDEVPIEKPRIVNPEIPPSEIIHRNDGSIVIIDPPAPPPPPPPPRPFPDQGSTSILDDFSGGQIGVDAENLDKLLADVINQVNIEVEKQKDTTSSQDSAKISPVNNNIDNGIQPPSLEDIMKDAQLQFDQISQLQLKDSIIQNKPDPILETMGLASEQSISNTPNIPLDLNTRPINEPISTFPDLSTTDNFDSNDAKKLVQLIEERRELLRQLREQDKMVSNPTFDDARSAPFRTTQRLSDEFDDFGILRSNIPQGLTPLVGNSIGVPANTVTDSESRRNNRPTDLLADAGRVNAPATIRQIFLEDDDRSLNLPSGVPGIGTKQILPTDSFDDNLGPGLDDDFIQRRNALLAQRQLLEEQLARVSRQTLPTANTATPLDIPSDFNSGPSLRRIPIGDFDNNFQTFGVNQNLGDDDLGFPGIRSQQTPLRPIPGLFSPDIGSANVLASRNRNILLPSPISTVRRPQQQDLISGFSDNSVFRSPNNRVPSRDLLQRQFQRGLNARALSGDLDDESSVPGTSIPRFPSSLSNIRPGSGIDLLQQTRNNVRIPGVLSPWRPGFRDSIFSSSDDDEPMLQNRVPQFRGFSSSLNNLRPSPGFLGLQNFPPRVPGVSSPLDNGRSNAPNRNRNNPFAIPGVLSSFGVSTSDDDSSTVDVRNNIGGSSGFSSSLNNIRRPGVLGPALHRHLPFPDDDSSPVDVQNNNIWRARFPSPLNNIRRPGVLGLAPPQRLPLTDDDSSSGDVRNNIRGNSGFSTSFNNIRPAGFVSQAQSQRSSLTGVRRTLDIPQIPLPPPAILDDDAGNTRQNLRTDDGRISQQSGDFPEFNRQVEQLLQGSSSRGSFNDDDTIQVPFSWRRHIPNFDPSLDRLHGSFLRRQRGVF